MSAYYRKKTYFLNLDLRIIVSESSICDKIVDCQDGSDELCHDECYKTQGEEKVILRRCQENAAICVPVSKYCDIVYDCPLGSDEINCSCDAWNMKSCDISGTDLCIYHEWLGEDVNSKSCLGLLENQAIDASIEIEECMEYGKPEVERNVKTTTHSSVILTGNGTTFSDRKETEQETTMVRTTEEPHQTSEYTGMDCMSFQWLRQCG